MLQLHSSTAAVSTPALSPDAQKNWTSSTAQACVKRYSRSVGTIEKQEHTGEEVEKDIQAGKIELSSLERRS